ncbi:hypothetical protein BC828DRAFT_379661 [Blastocladiella britannica]|nr:hypothetical protein BC828DRAFT_379661 [Blastocladiella britannica]
MTSALGTHTKRFSTCFSMNMLLILVRYHRFPHPFGRYMTRTHNFGKRSQNCMLATMWIWCRSALTFNDPEYIYISDHQHDSCLLPCTCQPHSLMLTACYASRLTRPNGASLLITWREYFTADHDHEELTRAMPSTDTIAAWRSADMLTIQKS